VPAPAVIPAPKIYFKVVAVKTLVVGCLNSQIVQNFPTKLKLAHAFGRSKEHLGVLENSLGI